MLLRSMGLVSALNIAKALATFGASLLLARYVPPADFGLVSFAMPLMLLLTLLTDLGLASAVLRAPELAPRVIGAAHALLLIVGGLGAGLLVLAAAALERASGLPGLAHVLHAFALVAWLSIAAVLPRALLERRFDYGGIVRAELLALGAAVLGFLLLLAAGAGLDALLAFHLLLQGLRAAVLNWRARADCRPQRDLALARPLLGIGAWVMASNLVGYAARNVDRFIVGSVLGAAALGLYGMAYQFMIVPLMLMAWPVSGVLLNALSRLGPASPRRAPLVLAVLSLTATLAGGCAALVVVGLPYVVGAVLNPRWAPLPGLVLWLMPLGVLQAVAAYGGAVFFAAGSERLQFVLTVLNAAFVCVAFAVFSREGIEVAVMAYTAASVAVSLLVLVKMAHSIGVAPGRLFAAVLPGLVLCALPLAVSAVAGSQLQSFGGWTLALAATLTWCALVCVFLRHRLRDAIAALREVRHIGKAHEQHAE